MLVGHGSIIPVVVRYYAPAVGSRSLDVARLRTVPKHCWTSQQLHPAAAEILDNLLLVYTHLGTEPKRRQELIDQALRAGLAALAAPPAGALVKRGRTRGGLRVVSTLLPAENAPELGCN